MIILDENRFHAAYKSFEDTETRTVTAGKLLGLQDAASKAFSSPSLQILVHFSVRMDAGDKAHFEGYLVVTALGNNAIKGTVTFAPELNLDAAKAAAALLKVKAAFWENGCGGAHGGIICDPSQLSEVEVHRLVMAYTQAIKDVYEQHQYGTVPELTIALPASPQEINGADTYNNPGYTSIKHWQEWLSDLIQQQLRSSGATKTGGTAICYGWSAKDRAIAATLYGKGFKILAVSDGDLAYYSPYGIDIPNLTNFMKRNNGAIKGYPHAIPVALSKMLFYEADVLLLGEGANNVIGLPEKDINAKLVVETGDYKITADLENWLTNKGTSVLPDVLVNALPYYNTAATANSTSTPAQETTVAAILQHKTVLLFTTIAQYNVSARTAAYIIALNNATRTTAVRDKLKGNMASCFSQ